MTDLRFARDLALVLGALLLLFLYITNGLAIPWVVGGPSMRPNLEPGDRVLVDLWTYRHRTPRPGEVALLDGPGDVPIVKRVVGGPVARDSVPAPTFFHPVEAEEEWFVVRGDNLRESLDSRRFGPVPRHCFVGRVVLRYWPPSRVGPIR